VRSPLRSRLGQRLFFADETGTGLEVRLDVGSDLLRDRGQVIVALFRRPEMALIARQELTSMPAPVLTARLDLPELPPGLYSLNVVLKQQGLDGPVRIAEDRHLIRVLPSRLYGD